MKPLYRRLLQQTESELGELGKNLRSSPRGRVLGVRQLRRDIGPNKAMFSPSQPSVVLIYPSNLPSWPVFFELENDNVPAGYSLVTGADVEIYAALRKTTILVEDTQASISQEGSASGHFRPNLDAVALVKTEALTDAEPRPR